MYAYPFEMAAAVGMPAPAGLAGWPGIPPYMYCLPGPAAAMDPFTAVPAFRMEPFRMPQPARARMETLEILRRNLMGELEAISQYEADALAVQDPTIRARLLEIANDEKHHVAELTMAINRLDPGQAAQFARIRE